jgi:hypothetical protein
MPVVSFHTLHAAAWFGVNRLGRDGSMNANGPGPIVPSQYWFTRSNVDWCNASQLMV